MWCYWCWHWRWRDLRKLINWKLIDLCFHFDQIWPGGGRLIISSDTWRSSKTLGGKYFSLIVEREERALSVLVSSIPIKRCQMWSAERFFLEMGLTKVSKQGSVWPVNTKCVFVAETVLRHYTQDNGIVSISCSWIEAFQPLCPQHCYVSFNLNHGNLWLGVW